MFAQLACPMIRAGQEPDAGEQGEWTSQLEPPMVLGMTVNSPNPANDHAPTARFRWRFRLEGA